ncbi:MAG TPA: hypothetical protein VIV57_19540 [Anaeromyxobacter sp.]
MRIHAAVRAATAAALLAAAAAARAQACPATPDQLSVNTTVDVGFDASTGLFTYTYTVLNAATSTQPMDGFAVVDFALPVDKVASPPGWTGAVLPEQNTVLWIAVAVSEPDVVPADGDAGVPASSAQIVPGASLGGFSFQSPKPPGQVGFRATGFAPVDVQTGATDGDAEASGEALLETCPHLARPARDLGIAGATTGPVNSIRVSIDLKPGSAVNPVNPSSQGVLPVAVLGTATFDVQTVDAASVRLGRGAAAPQDGGHLEDVNGDGILDLVFQFPTPAVGVRCGDSSISLTGQTSTGTPISGSDSLVTVGCR